MKLQEYKHTHGDKRVALVDADTGWFMDIDICDVEDYQDYDACFLEGGGYGDCIHDSELRKPTEIKDDK